MFKSLWIIPAVVINSFVLAAEPKPAADAAGKTDKMAWTVEATPGATTVQPGGKLDLKVRIVNNADAKATVYIRNLLWYAKSDNPNVVFQQWPARGGLGPVITYKSVELAPTEAYAHDWTATIAKDAPTGEIAFRMGVPLKFVNGQPEQTIWSDPMKITVKTPDAAKTANP